ncbi:biotin--[acetyl-CoA-carboxylase] ligase [Prevotella disiens FB035-09AN]|uniref:Biotin--[acetyl-CoA-carboxylase] ligase n=1 Tax=Prevotella disiens FB035-09AN TaxID=866771 RepID=E1KRW2_9BACT|nr:biotin--[acetyl-CoA-carboxylase] ligase [Prevotella disiens]EFL45686.1 biotin--[acetyl-CoA-carboxylase] ligase [Prevotella disiens FB035-09AN]
MKIIDKLKTAFRKKPVSTTKIIRLESVESTNDYLRTYKPEENEPMTVVMADYQTAGRGQGTNKWESEAGKNLLFSVLLHPYEIPIATQFLLSMYGALCLRDVLTKYVGEDITLKWPNDIYWKNKKLSGTLIETKLSGGRIKDCIFGVGLNVNQTVFKSDAPNPVSLCQILGKEIDREALLQKIVQAFERNYEWIRSANYGAISSMYHDALYRGKGFYWYEDKDGAFEGAIVEVEDNGHLILRDREGRIRTYEFKEIKYGKI